MHPADEIIIATVIEAVTRGAYRSDNTDDDADADADDPDDDDAYDDVADADDNDADDDDDADHDADADADDDDADVGASYHRDAEVPDCWIAHPPAGNARWVQTVRRQVTCTLLTKLLLQQ